MYVSVPERLGMELRVESSYPALTARLFGAAYCGLNCGLGSGRSQRATRPGQNLLPHDHRSLRQYIHDHDLNHVTGARDYARAQEVAVCRDRVDLDPEVRRV